MANEGEKKAMVMGFFGEYGGQFIPKTLKKRLDDLDAAFRDAMADKAFHEEYLELLRNYVGRPSALTECRNISKDLGGGRLFLKREDLNHGGAHKINNCIDQTPPFVWREQARRPASNVESTRGQGAKQLSPKGDLRRKRVQLSAETIQPRPRTSPSQAVIRSSSPNTRSATSKAHTTV